MLQLVTLVLLSLVLAFNIPPVISATSTSNDQASITNVVLVGALGDLSKKYLWQGLFDLYLAEETTGHKINFYAAGRISGEDGTTMMSDILDDRVKCKDPLDTSCGERLKAFKSLVVYKQLKTADQYAEFCRAMVDEMGSAKENGRLFYLAVPPFAYAGIAENIHKGCRPPSDGDTWLRVVLEKPFGHDLQSARELASQLSGFLKEEEVYRIDHYLGKLGVQSILPFRHANKGTYDRIWNRDHVARVEIVMKEDIDVKGRLEFYDSYGVIRDVMQNHLTEIMALIGMETPNNISNHQQTLANKLRFLHQVQPINAKRAVIGQYDGYASQWQEELQKSSDEKVHTPTFAGVALYVNNPRWTDVPFIMTAGKALDEKVGYVRVLFQDNSICMKKSSKDFLSNCDTKQVIFLTSNANSKYPSVLISKNLPEPEMPPPWKKTDFSDDLKFLGFPLKGFRYYSQPDEISAYTSLISACFHGNKDKFVGTEDLMASWGIWTPLLDDIAGKQPRIYPSGDSCGNWLDFQVSHHHNKLYFINDVDDEWEMNTAGGFSTLNVAALSDSYRSNPLVSGSKEEVIERLAVHLRNIAADAIRERGEFHLALSGGKTPKQLYAYFALRMNVDLPWDKIHIWLVDERCVPTTDEKSNFRMLYSSLLKFVQIPIINVHQMPVELPNGLCDSIDKGARIYESELLRTIPSGRLDYVLLGMGADGHTASLFPNQSALEETRDMVVITDGGPSDDIPKRMTLTYSAINSARHAGVLVMGKTKRKMIALLKSEGVVDKRKYPITGVQLTDGELVWYMDHKALF